MSLVSSRLSLTHAATVERDANLGQVDAGGYPLSPDWQAHLSALPCRLWATAGREVVANTTTVVVIEDLRMIVTTDPDILDTDRVGDVTYRGDTILTGPVSIRGVLRHADHIELVLEKVS